MEITIQLLACHYHKVSVHTPYGIHLLGKMNALYRSRPSLLTLAPRRSKPSRLVPFVKSGEVWLASFSNGEMALDRHRCPRGAEGRHEDNSGLLGPGPRKRQTRLRRPMGGNPQVADNLWRENYHST